MNTLALLETRIPASKAASLRTATALVVFLAQALCLFTGVAQAANEDSLARVGKYFSTGMRPFGMVMPVLVNSGKGIGFIRFYGAGCGWGNRSVITAIGTRSPGPDADLSGSSMNRDALSTATYSVAGAALRLAPHIRSAIGEITYAATQNGKGHFQISSVSAAEISGGNAIKASFDMAGFCGHGGGTERIFVHLEFDRSFSASSVWEEGRGAHVSFDVQPGQKVFFKIGFSWTNAANARLNAITEIPVFDFDAVLRANQEDWKSRYARVRVDGGSPGMRKHFYNCWHIAQFHPNVMSDVNGDYMGFDEKPHNSASSVTYMNYSGWDTYRTWLPLMAMINPDDVGDMMETLTNAALTGGGGFPHWPYGYHESSTMEGDPGSAMIATAHAYGVTKFNLDRAIKAMFNTALDPKAQSSPGFMARHGLASYIQNGYVTKNNQGPNDTRSSMTMEYCLSDYAIARLLRRVNREPDLARYLERRSQNFKVMWNSGLGILRAPDAASNYQQFNEGSAEQYLWMVPHNWAGLAKLLGGTEKAAERLESHLTRTDCLKSNHPDNPCPDLGNEPSIHTHWVFNWFGKPWMTQRAVRRMMGRVFTQTTTGDYSGKILGQEDMGAMSSWSVFCMSGLYPAIPGEPGFALSSQLFDRIELPFGKKSIVITAAGQAYDAPYVQSLKVNGTPHNSSWLPFSLLDRQVNTLEFVLGKEPNMSWGNTPAPPSFDAEPCYAANGCKDIPADIPVASSGKLSTATFAGARLSVVNGALVLLLNKSDRFELSVFRPDGSLAVRRGGYGETAAVSMRGFAAGTYCVRVSTEASGSTYHSIVNQD